MALQIISVLLFTVFFSKALTLVCYNCTTIDSSATCTQTAICPLNSQCRYMSALSGGNKSCIDSALCANWTMHVGESLFSRCCGSDRCNSALAADPDNELTCYTCSGTNCSKTLKCKGDENRCITVGLKNRPTLKGCASQNICNNNSLVMPALIPILTVSSVSCCEANLCNNAQSTTQGLFLLVPVLSLFFSI